MKYANRSGFRNRSTENNTPDWLCVIHRIVCTVCSMVVVLSFLRCSLSFIGALQDANKFSGLGFSYPFYHYLLENQFPEDALMCLLVFTELLHYVFQYRRATAFRPLRGMIWCFAGMLLFHSIIWWHANSIMVSSTSTWASYYYDYANISILPSAAYFAIYLLRIQDV